MQLLWVHLKWTKCIYSMMSYEPAWISATMTNTDTYKEQCNHPFDERWLQLPWKQRCYGEYTICYGPPYAETWYLKSNKSLSIRDTRATWHTRTVVGKCALSEPQVCINRRIIICHIWRPWRLWWWRHHPHCAMYFNGAVRLRELFFRKKNCLGWESVELSTQTVAKVFSKAS